MRDARPNLEPLREKRNTVSGSTRGRASGLRTRPRSTSHGQKTNAAKNADTAFAGMRCSGRKVCVISGRGAKATSSGCVGGGCEAGTYRSKSSYCTGECTKEPRIRDTFRGLADVGGRDVGGRAMFCAQSRQNSVQTHTHAKIQRLYSLARIWPFLQV